MNLKGSTAIVTGGAVRIGREISCELARQGMNVCVHFGQSSQAAENLVGELRHWGVAASSVQADLSDSVRAADIIFAHAASEHGPVSALINSAAIFERATLAQTDEQLWDRHLNINLKAPFFLTREFARRFGDQSAGAVVNILDWRALKPVPGHDAYTIAKAGLAALTPMLAQELGPRIRVNGVAPGAILPPPGESQSDWERRAQLNPLKRVGHPGEIARAVVYLLEADFVTGEILHVTGGEQLV